FASLELYSADDLQRADDLLSGVEPTNGRYSVELDEGDYVLTGRSANGADLGSIAVSVSESGCDHTVYAITATCKNAGWAYGRDYTVSGRAFSGGGGGVPVERSIVMGANGSFLCFVGDSVTAKFDPSAARIREGYAPASAGSVVTGPNYASLSAECSPAAVLNITYPYADKNEDGENDFVLEAGQLTQYFIYSYLTPDTVERPDGGETVTAVFEGLGKGNYFYRVSDPLNDDAVTYGNYCSAESGDNHVSVSAQDMHIGDDALKKNTVIDDFSANAYDTGDLYLAVTGSGFDGAAGQLNMSSGDVAALYPFRNWLAIEGTGNSKVIEPDFHVEVTDLVGSPVTVTEKTADDSSKHSYAIEAVSPGTAILTVTYDAVINGAGLGGSVFSAIRPENTGVIVVTVDGQSGFDTHITINEALNTDQTGKLAHEKYDAELDVLYYCGTDGASYTFRPDSGTEVTVAAGSCDGGRLSFGEFSDAGVSAAPDTGEVTVSGLMQGKSVIRLVKDGKTEYQVLRARHTDLVVKNAAGEIYCDTSTGYIDPEMRFEPGEKISLTYSDIQHPANKLSGIYNMQANVMLIGSGGAAVNGKAAQYDFGSAAAAHRVNVIIPEDAQGTYALTGVIRVNGYGSYFGQHRELTYEYGKTSNYTAVRQTGYFGMLPGAVLPIAGADAGTVTVAAYDYNAAEAGLSGASQTGVIFEQTIALSPGATAEEVVRAAFGQAGVDYEISGAGGSSAYVSSLNGLGAGAGMSGWVLNYNNDDFANWGLAYITPADGDSISFHYSVNPDGATDDVGSGWYGKAIFTSFTLAGVTREMSKITEYAQDYSAVTTYYLGSEVIDGS
ncbi:MAG: DUF4430 domain-containing protein, partial [Oscillospiraceae bacterium]|nr:DUF4430 domain-containing protein [Oscillospiraceae bacterium]